MSQVIRNWSDYNAGLTQRGSLTFWIDEDVLVGWVERQLSGKRGKSRYYSDLVIATMRIIKSVYGLAGCDLNLMLDTESSVKLSFWNFGD
jgi:hypothetical protein